DPRPQPALGQHVEQQPAGDVVAKLEDGDRVAASVAGRQDPTPSYGASGAAALGSQGPGSVDRSNTHGEYLESVRGCRGVAPRSKSWRLEPLRERPGRSERREPGVALALRPRARRGLLTPTSRGFACRSRTPSGRSNHRTGTVRISDAHI